MSFRIVDWNYAFDPSVTITASSSDPEFPASNLTSHFRSKVWRSSGNWDITSSNKYLDFSEGGSEINVSIPEGSYTTAELEAAIQSAIDAGGAYDYTVSWSESTGKWTIGTSHTVLSLLWDSGANTESSIGSDLGFDVSGDSTSATSYTGANVAIHTSEWVQFDLITWGTNPVDSIVVLFDKLVGSNLTNAAVVKFQASQTQSFSSPSVNQTVTLSNAFQMLSYFASSAQNYRFWRISITDPRNTDLYVEIPLVFIGYSNQVITQSPEIGFQQAIVDKSDGQDSAYGDTYFDINPNVNSVTYNWAHLPDDQCSELRSIFDRVGNVTPILMVVDDQETVFSNVEEHIHYARIVGNLSSTQSFLDYFNKGIQLLEVI